MGWWTRPKFGWPGDRAKVDSERCAAHPGHRCLDGSLRRRSHRSEFGIEVTALGAEPATSRPLNGDTGVLSRTSAVELRSEILGPYTPH
jgi:hypothetical protein